MVEIKSTKSTMDYMIKGIRYVCENYKDRAPGTKSERDSQEFFKDELENFADESYMEDFDLHPHAFMGFIPVAGIFMLFSVACIWLAESSVVFSIVGTILPIISVLMFLFEFLFYKSFVDIFFPKRVSRNVMATRKPIGEVKRRIIFGGHADASYEWNYSLHGQLKTLAPVIGGSITGMFFVFGANLIYTIMTFVKGESIALEGAWKIIAIIELFLCIFFVAIIFFINWGKIVDGANDNLSACYVAMGVLKEMSDANFRFENTEVCCLISGSEEAGLRGAKAFAKKHKDELLATETVYISMDTMREIEQLQIYTRGCTGTVKDSEAVGDLLHEAGLKVGYDMPRAELYPGAVDAEGFSIYGIRACGFCGVNHDPKTYYHTRMDSWDNISEECIGVSLDICMEAAHLYDANGGIAKYEDVRKKK